ncbi:MAG: hypothetical protein KatS3mg059_0466 [Thermomicrobiales bacterium]|nr:MAG: hypothetical protein KatS3mg059_0466 [Thermomicrobiales bacterium]
MRRRAARILAACLPGIPITASSEITKEWREYERTSTAVLNAYVRPTASAYLASLERQLRDYGIASPLDVMKSQWWHGDVRCLAAAAHSHG